MRGCSLMGIGRGGGSLVCMRQRVVRAHDGWFGRLRGGAFHPVLCSVWADGKERATARKGPGLLDIARYTPRKDDVGWKRGLHAVASQPTSLGFGQGRKPLSNPPQRKIRNRAPYHPTHLPQPVATYPLPLEESHPRLLPIILPWFPSHPSIAVDSNFPGSQRSTGRQTRGPSRLCTGPG